MQAKSMLKPGCRVGPYEMVRLLGVGYSGEVHEATEALVATGATIAFDATGGGELAGQILAGMETALNRKAKSYSR